MEIQVLLAYTMNSLPAHLSVQLGYHLAYDSQSDAHVTLIDIGFNPYTRDGKGYHFIDTYSLTHLLICLLPLIHSGMCAHSALLVELWTSRCWPRFCFGYFFFMPQLSLYSCWHFMVSTIYSLAGSLIYSLYYRTTRVHNIRFVRYKWGL